MTSSESKAGNRVLAGMCRCGAVRYEVTDAFLYAANCHCSGCRAATGSAFKAFAGIERERRTVTKGLEDIAVFGEDDLNDTRCWACGSFLFSVVRDGAHVHVAMGSLVDAPTIRPAQHIFVGSKAAWVRDHRRPAARRVRDKAVAGQLFRNVPRRRFASYVARERGLDMTRFELAKLTSGGAK